MIYKQYLPSMYAMEDIENVEYTSKFYHLYIYFFISELTLNTGQYTSKFYPPYNGRVRK